MKKYIIITLMTFAFYSLFSQNNDKNLIIDTVQNQPEIKTLAAFFGDSVIVRWAPNGVDGWMMGFNRGYNIERITLNDSLMPVSKKWKKLNAELIFPFSIKEFKILFNRAETDDYALIAAESLYGKYGLSGEKEVQPNYIGDILLESEDFKNRFAMCLLSADFSEIAANSMGWRWVDRTVSKDSAYMYKISCPAIENNPMFLKPGFVTIKTKKQYNVKPIISKLDELENQINILLPRDFSERHFTGFWIEKSIDDGKTYRRLNKLPYLNPLTNDNKIGNKEYIVYSDTFSQNYIPALYRVIGITPFAIESKPSRAVKGMGRDKTPPALPDSIKAEMLIDNTMEIKWYYDKLPDDLQGFYIAKSGKPYGDFILLQEGILPKNTRSYIDKNPTIGQCNYYTLISVDTAGNGNRSHATLGNYIDSIPPEKPVNLEGNIDTNGVVTIVWDLGKENDLYGYFIYKSNNKNHVFTNVTGLVFKDTVFTDTISLSTLTEEIYYKIVAVDINYNESGFSELLILKKPDFIAPTPPLLIKTITTENSIKLTYKKSHSTDVEYYKLIRLNNNIDTNITFWDTIQTFTPDNIPDTLIDIDLKPNTRYTYAFIAVDDAGNLSEIAYSLNVKTKNISPIDKIIDFELEKNKKLVNIKWKFKGRDTDRILIYRASKGKKFKLIKNIRASKNLFVDKQIKTGLQYRYNLILESKNGGTLDYTKHKQITIE